MGNSLISTQTVSNPTPAMAIRKSMSNLPGVTLVLDGAKSLRTMTLRDAIKDVRFGAIYFGADWCPPCKAFDQALKSFY